ncbi:MAG: 50S ribosomal protein L24 [Bacilli bacterium]
MKIKKGDKVKVISGADKGKEGIVQKAFPKLNKVVIEGVSVHKKHKKPTQQNPEGSILDIYTPIDVSNVMLIDPKTKKVTRVGYTFKTDKAGKVSKVRIAKKSNSVLD